MDPVKATQKNIEENKILTLNEAQTYYSEMIYFKNQIFQSGKIYLQNNVTAYLDSIISKLLYSEPKIKSEIKVYLTRYTQANAFCLADGSVFINSGLLATVNNETELAFILAHEIAHYANQHNIKDLRKVHDIEKQETNYDNTNANTYRSLRFSRESEYDADSWALQLIAQAGYDPNLAGDALEKFKKDKAVTALDFYKAFNNESFKIDTNWQSKKAIQDARNNYSPKEENLITGSMGDLLETHPDIVKRIEAVKLMAKDTRRKDKAITDTSFNLIKQISEFEQVENNYLEQDYINSILNALRLLEKFPDNVYLHVSISRALYWLSYYKEIGVNTLLINSDIGQNGDEVYKFYALINEMDQKEVKKMAYTYIRVRSDLYPDHEPVLFYLAINTENYLGKSAARNYYRDYQEKFPNGLFSAYTRNKLQ